MRPSTRRGLPTLAQGARSEAEGRGVSARGAAESSDSFKGSEFESDAAPRTTRQPPAASRRPYNVLVPRMTTWLARPALLRALFEQARVAARLVRDPSVPWFFKAALLLPLAYVVSPIDALPDVLPVLGQLDDLAIVTLAVQAFLKLCPQAVVAHHRAAVGRRQGYSPAASPSGAAAGSGEVIDAEWRREN